MSCCNLLSFLALTPSACHPPTPFHLTLPTSSPPPQRLLDYIRPDFVHIMEAGRITTTGDMTLVDQLEAGGYATLAA
jgi:hypothetical protein